MNPQAKRLCTLGVLSVISLITLLSSDSFAVVRKAGVWPAEDKLVTLDADGLTRPQAVRKVAEAAGLSVVFSGPPGDPVDLHLRDQPAFRVLEMILADDSYVATRDGKLLSIARDSQSAGASPHLPSTVAPAQPAVDPGPAVDARADSDAEDAREPKKVEKSSKDRVITGSSARVEKGEVVKDLVVMGGRADIFGTVEGDLVVMGGGARLYSSGRVLGDASVMGGELELDEGARIDGEAKVVGGALKRNAGAHIGGDDGNTSAAINLPNSKREDRSDGLTVGELAAKVGSAMTASALLFVFGAVFFALATGRMESLESEVAARPMKSFALGIVGSAVALIVLVALCVTIIGIPFAIIAILLATLGAYVGICAVLATVGRSLIGHRTSNPYLHLALGCALFLILGAIPYVGGIVVAAVVLIGMGALVATRVAGLVQPSSRNSQGPYRTAAV